MRIASSSRVTPRAVNSLVITGWEKLAGTKLWAARLYSSCGRDSSTSRTRDNWSNRSA